MKTHHSVQRCLTLLDAMILVAATAVGLSLTGLLWDSMLGEYFYRPVSGWTSKAILAKAPLTVLLFLPLLTAWSFALLLLRLRRPRPRLNRLALQPGTAACGAAILVIAMTHVGLLARWVVEVIVMGEVMFHRADSLDDYFFIQFAPSTTSIACSVAAAWVLLAAVQLGRPEPSWIDRTGLVLGVMWIAAALCQWWYDVSGGLAVDWHIGG
jgi:hypothetical protein